jgi:NAD(P)-dependent dehydrogenase (short-subunit alcohol dehydrogenase family)
MSVKPKILVTAASGKTGSAVVQQLLEKHFPVRALVHRQDHRSEALRRAGAEIFSGNMMDMRDLRKALTGVQRAYFCAPFAPNNLHASVAFAVAAQEAKLEVVRFFVKMLLTPAPDMDGYERRRNHVLLREPLYAPEAEEWQVTHTGPHSGIDPIKQVRFAG